MRAWVMMMSAEKCGSCSCSCCADIVSPSLNSCEISRHSFTAVALTGKGSRIDHDGLTLVVVILKCNQIFYQNKVPS
jgi:hypothetical protein